MLARGACGSTSGDTQSPGWSAAGSGRTSVARRRGGAGPRGTGPGRPGTASSHAARTSPGRTGGTKSRARSPRPVCRAPPRGRRPAGDGRPERASARPSGPRWPPACAAGSASAAAAFSLPAQGHGVENTAGVAGRRRRRCGSPGKGRGDAAEVYTVHEGEKRQAADSWRVQCMRTVAVHRSTALLIIWRYAC